MTDRIPARAIALVILSLLAAASPSALAAAEEEPIADEPWAQISYGFGYQMGANLMQSTGDQVDVDALVAGIRDALAGAPQRVSRADLEEAQRVVSEQLAAEREQASAATAAEARTFLAENATRSEVTVTASGLQYEVLKAGTGASPVATDTVVTHYTGRLIDGTVFDSSEARGQPATFRLNQVIPGWTEALQLMQEGARWRIYLPPELAYGERGAGSDIPPNSALVFEVELIEVNPSGS